MAASLLRRGKYEKEEREEKREMIKTQGFVQSNLLRCVPNNRYAHVLFKYREAGMEFRSKTIGILNVRNEIPA